MSGGKCRNSICIYGQSGAGKTTQIGELAEYIYNTTGKRLRLVSASGGGWAVIDAHVGMGLIEPTFIVGRAYPFESMHKLSLGWWPEDPADPRSELIPPQKQDWSQIGGWAFDSMTEIAEWMMRYSVEQEAAGKWRISGQQAAAKFRDGSLSLGSPSMGMYGTIQNYVSQYISQSKALPDMYVLWTALEAKATDDNKRLPIFGPEVIGNAKTSKVPAWFDNVLHLYIEGDKQGNKHRRMYLTEHLEDGVPFLAKNTASMKAPLPSYLEGDKLTLIYFFELLEESKKKVSSTLNERKVRNGV